ncbi:hypothetical protein OJF2_60850 [Aquisphaera giovannonii]|uniref:Uncharacterized protein n=1 Tax=Aquisphaera giovannonii TaxID=406548 RepID=A0A5B9WB68_9BACT|nr:hypothetical protein [Aquisphaera giovannonii]QEH37494.1 hypothetical protein OJF2_60850 [Aquisphaera giovannonii]
MPRANASRRKSLAATLLNISSSISDPSAPGRVEHWADEEYEYTEFHLPDRLATELDLSISGSTVLIRSIRGGVPVVRVLAEAAAAAV